MKIFKIVIYVLAIASSVTTAIAYNSIDDISITNTGYTLGDCVQLSTCEKDICDEDLTSGIQCRLLIGGGCNLPAYKADCVTPLYRPRVNL